MTGKRAGRPYVVGLSDALLQAAERVMVTDGFSGLTVDGLVSEVGTTRPTFYRRYPSVAHVAFEVIRNRFGTGAAVHTGSLYEDLLRLQREDIAMFSSPLLRNNLPGLMESIRSDATVRDLYHEHFIGPRRANVGDVIKSAITSGEIPDRPIDVELVCDLLLGPILARVLLPLDAKVDDRLARQTTALVIEHLTALPIGQQTSQDA